MRVALPPRLYLAKSKDRQPTWVLRDGPVFIRTGMREDQIDDATVVLNSYLEGGTFKIRRDRYTPPVPEPWTRPCLIYFISCNVPDFPIKIGSAHDLEKRTRAIQTSLPFPVVVLSAMPGTADQERDLHLHFWELRLRGEWFKRGKALLDYIARSVEINRGAAHLRAHAADL
jgi:hypothetical protein